MTVSTLIKQMLSDYHDPTVPLRDRLREILQQCALLGLSRHNFFEHTCFYGGTALRILHGLDRFSEDLDFSLISSRSEFNLEPFLLGLEQELSAMGLKIHVSKKY